MSGKQYAMVIVDDFSRYTWVLFLGSKDESFMLFQKFHRKVQNESGLQIISIRSDHGREFENQQFSDFCDNFGINHNFSAPRTPQQNGVVERKNRTLIEMARTMIIESGLPKSFWAEAVQTACFIINRV
ncbi:DDE-type integrase/transposase/recombinase, partial [Escherichia coli]|uniref:DDE-type integrase/transposase/recombinase n=1 Tax=Escherichia coli TaxID=562 RepID=UPI00203F67F1